MNHSTGLSIVLFFVSLCAPCGRLVAYAYELAICTIFKDCAPFLKEWIEYHRLIGVEHFYLYDNSSSDHSLAVLAPYIEEGVVTVTNWPNRDVELWPTLAWPWPATTQDPAYRDNLQQAASVAKWVAYIDSDEFIVPMQDETAVDFLRRYDAYSGMPINWRVYGTSNVYSIPPNKLMVELLTMSSLPENGMNFVVKWIVKPEEVVYFHGHHYVETKKNTPTTADEIRLNHYIYRTIEFYTNVKQKNQTATGPGIYFNDVEDRVMDRFIPDLRRRMGFESEEGCRFISSSGEGTKGPEFDFWSRWPPWSLPHETKLNQYPLRAL